jgi:hypothetical protein
MVNIVLKCYSCFNRLLKCPIMQVYPRNFSASSVESVHLLNAMLCTYDNALFCNYRVMGNLDCHFVGVGGKEQSAWRRLLLEKQIMFTVNKFLAFYRTRKFKKLLNWDSYWCLLRSMHLNPLPPHLRCILMVYSRIFVLVFISCFLLLG